MLAWAWNLGSLGLLASSTFGNGKRIKGKALVTEQEAFPA